MCRWYNLGVPTPFYHMAVAETLLHHPALPEAVRTRLMEQRAAFVFGNTAPDVQVVSGQERHATHFFKIPIRPGSPLPWARLLSAFPALARPDVLPGAQAAFLAGYLLHLQADWFWILTIFAPIFGPDCTWGSFPERLYLHNVLRSYLDMQVIAELPARTSGRFMSLHPQDWLPFVEDRHLVEWRDYLAQQLQPGAAAQTVEVFAARQGISPQEFYQLLESEQRMDEQIFSRLPRSILQHYRRQLIELNLTSLESYFRGDGWLESQPLDQRRRKPGLLDEVSA
jgi:hypothetical protein